MIIVKTIMSNKIQKTIHIEQKYYPIILMQEGKTLSAKVNNILKRLYKEESEKIKIIT